MKTKEDRRRFKRFCTLCGKGYKNRFRRIHKDTPLCEHHLKRFLNLRRLGVCECVYEYECMESKKKEEIKDNHSLFHIHSHIHTQAGVF